MYGFSVSLAGNMGEVRARVAEELKTEGFDVAATLKAKLDIDRRPYRILGACNPALAHRALEKDPDIGLLLPCNVVVREEEDGSVTVAFMDPESILGLVESDDVEVLAREVRARLERVRTALIG
jgi:uncharacterized protein (DUF302 family)